MSSLQKLILVILVSIKFAQTFHLEPIDFINVESFDGVRSYPVFQLAMSPEDSDKVIKVKMSEELKQSMDEKKNNNMKNPSSVQQQKSTIPHDKVRDFEPMSRDDIKNLKKLSFHGRTPSKLSPNTTTTNIPPEEESMPKQNNFDIRKTKNNNQKPKLKPKAKIHRVKAVPPAATPDRKRAASSKVETRLPTKFNRKKQNDIMKKIPRNIDKGFLPLMKPSPIQVHSPSAPSFSTMRNYVDYLKQRQKIFFDDLEKDNEKLNLGEELVGDEKSRYNPESEIEYFRKREQELAEEQRPKDSTTKDDEEEISSKKVTASREMDEEETENESRKYENFVPFRMYAQVRHIEAEHHKPQYEADEPKVKEKLTLEKKNTYFSEEGYNEKNYDHKLENVDSHYSRSKREISSNDEPTPYALALIKKSDIENLSGRKLFEQLNRMISDADHPITDRSDRMSDKYPYYKLPDTDTLNTMSAFRYSENIKNFPKTKQTFYDYKNLKKCQEFDDDIDPTRNGNTGKTDSSGVRPKLIKNLDEKMNCFKNKMFGKNPLDNPIFDEEYVAASIPIPVKQSSGIIHQVNPLIAVYDDVISNIRASFAEEIRKKREKQAEELLHESETNQVERTSNKPDIKIFNLNSAASSSRLPHRNLPIFDINTYYPKFKAAINNDDDEVKTTKRNISQDFELEFVETKPPKHSKFSIHDAVKSPVEKRKYYESSIINLRPPIITPTVPIVEKRKRRNPIPSSMMMMDLSKSKTFLPKPTQFMKPPANQKFKLL